jgi:hypothetical protein
MVVEIVIVAFIVAQGYFFSKNIKCMNEYRNIFKEEDSWNVSYNTETCLVSGINGIGNKVFDSIRDSINKYIGSNTGSVIDFTLLKDAIDRHCDSVEAEINTLTPMPLYCGLSGTMIGVIIGLGSLIIEGSITELLSSGTSSFDAAANGVNDLLWGIAFAMVASFVGIILTIIGSWIFKGWKSEGERRKNAFLEWLQAKLLPELASDTSEALKKLVTNLNKFNNTFAQNTSVLSSTFTKVNESYRVQAEIIETVHDMDFMKMADVNIRVLDEIKGCTDKLEKFNQYLNGVHGYTEAIYKFTSMFEEESNRLRVLEEIRDYFNRHKGEIAKDTADVDISLKNALRDIKENASSNIKELNHFIVQHSEDLKQIIKEEKDSFRQISNDIKEEFGKQLNNIPTLGKRLDELSYIPSKLDVLIEKIEHSNMALASKLEDAMLQTAQDASLDGQNENVLQGSNYKFPKWAGWLIITSVVIIALACIFNIVYNIFF